MAELTKSPGPMKKAEAAAYNPYGTARGFIAASHHIWFLRPDGKPDRVKWDLFPTWEAALTALGRCGDFKDPGYKGAMDAIVGAAVSTGDERILRLSVDRLVPVFQGKIRHLCHNDANAIAELTDEAMRYALLAMRAKLVSHIAYEGKAAAEGFARDGWMVWKKGYGAVGDMGGRIQVFERVTWPHNGIPRR